MWEACSSKRIAPISLSASSTSLKSILTSMRTLGMSNSRCFEACRVSLPPNISVLQCQNGLNSKDMEWNLKKKIWLQRTLLERAYHFFCGCVITPEDPDPDEEDEPETGNLKIVDLLIFSEKNSLYFIFSMICQALSMFSVYYYLYIIAAGRFYKEQEEHNESLIWGYEPYIFTTIVLEMIFFVDMLLQFFREYTPVGQGELSKPVKWWS